MTKEENKRGREGGKEKGQRQRQGRKRKEGSDGGREEGVLQRTIFLNTRSRL